MNKKLTLLVLLGCFVCLAGVMLAFDSSSSNLKKTHSTHDADFGYSPSNGECQGKCSAVKGISCGKNWQNCCVSNACKSGWFGSQTCDTRIAVAGCTPP